MNEIPILNMKYIPVPRVHCIVLIKFMIIGISLQADDNENSALFDGNGGVCNVRGCTRMSTRIRLQEYMYVY